MSNGEKNKSDPIRAAYFEPLERAECISNVAFYSAAILSIAVLVINPNSVPPLYSFVQISFPIAAIASFVVAIVVRVYFSPRAQDIRFADFLSNAFGAKLVPERTIRYYNSGGTEPIRKMGAQALENAMFSKEVARRMCSRERWTIALYLVAWLFSAFNRSTEFDLVIVASQVVFSEQLIFRAVRLEWLRGRSESVFDALYYLLQTTQEGGSECRTTFEARVVQQVVKYENAKSNAAVTLSSRIFDKLNASLSVTWDRIRDDLHL